MNLITDLVELKRVVEGWRAAGLRIGFVPTMGALHDGHLSLVEHAKTRCDRVITSIFVNPLQFGPDEDLDRYPRDLVKDQALLDDRDVDALFFPTPDLIYGPGHQTKVGLDVITKPLCGASRAGHFEGVTTVVCILFNLVKPHTVFLGRKDYQQYRVIERMVRDLHMDIEVIACPIVREGDGLAMSSRNAYLTAEERARATVLYKALLSVQKWVSDGEVDVALLLQKMNALVEPSVERIEYLEIRDPFTLESVKNVRKNVLCAGAIFVGKTRLIDNLEIEI